MLYEDGLHDLAEKLGSDLYIMPSSIHEVIAVSTDMGNPNELAAMVAEINMDQVAFDERLSNQVYHYDKDLRKVTLATDTRISVLMELLRKHLWYMKQARPDRRLPWKKRDNNGGACENGK